MADTPIPDTPVAHGTLYSSWAELKEDIENWAIAEHFPTGSC